MNKISILGAGSWGSAIAIHLSKKGWNVDLWMRNEEQRKDMQKTRLNKKYLDGVVFPENINFKNDIESSVEGAEIVVLAVSSQNVRSVLDKIKPYIKKDQILVDLAKGLEKESNKRLSEIAKEILPQNSYVALSGPSHAEEVSRELPTTLVSSSEDIDAAERIQDVFSSSKLRIYTNPDLTGVELGGALKNIIAFGAGIIDGLGYGDNTKAALMTRGIREIARLGVAMGANINTFTGLTGIGDLIVTCTSMHSRNRRAGILIGEGKSLEEALSEVKMVVEGVTATKVAYDLSKLYGISMPITNEIYEVLYKGKNVRESVTNLMMRSNKHEMEEVVENL